MTNALVVKAANLIRNGDIAGAEFALVSLAETEGDYALVAALETLPPKDLLAVIREYDTSKESVVNLVVTPEQFARAVVMERLYGDHSHVRLRGMINAVLFRDDSQTGEFIEAIGDVDGGCEALIDYLSDRDEEVVHFVTYDTFNVNRMEEGDEVDKAEISDRDWKELTWLLKHEHADMFEQIWPVLKKRMKERLRREAEQELLEQQAQESQEPQEPRKRPAAGAAPAAVADSGEESAL
ncbi:hypothetical protein [Collimonas sp.]|jgi:hypothetical protein|uniref:hypothetical protein n=1 Tax=Collimonas sp. TaxID=1963772 RepID=UPI002C98B057|nr:hypothetical protein [Collimonas sp.]HWX02076.1 hypothetical protein [Collimonas sp.]